MPMPEPANALAEARLAAERGQLEAADALYSAIAEVPEFRLESVSFLAFHRFLKQRYAESCVYAAQAVALEPCDRTRMQLARSQFGAGDDAAAETTLSQLSDPEFGGSSLLRGALFHRRGDSRRALACFEASLRRRAPGMDSSRLPPLLAQLWDLAGRVCADSLRSLHWQMFDELAGIHGQEPLQRIRRALAHYHGRAEPWQHELQRPSFFYVPGLPPEPWFERSDFPWVGQFEQRARAIHAEYLEFVARGSERLKSYITADQQAPRSSWGHLIDTDAWLSLHLFKGGERVEPNASQMPVTVSALEAVGLPDCPGNSPEAFFSTLAPGAHIPPHHGLANFKLTAHLALEVPEDCAIRVGGRARQWHPDQCLFFDDSFVHEAWNRSGRSRTVLIFDVWHPALTQIEKTALTQLFGPIDASCNYRLSGLMPA